MNGGREKERRVDREPASEAGHSCAIRFNTHEAQQTYTSFSPTCLPISGIATWCLRGSELSWWFTWGSMKRWPRLTATYSCIALVTLSNRKAFSISIFWNWSNSVFHSPGRSSLEKVRFGRSPSHPRTIFFSHAWMNTKRERETESRRRKTAAREDHLSRFYQEKSWSHKLRWEK